MFTDAYMLPVDRCIGHKHTKWQPAQLYHFSLSGSAMKALLSRVTRELWARLARKRYTRPSTPPPDLWSTQIGGSVSPFPGGRRRGYPPAHPRRLRPPGALRPQAAAPALPRSQAAADVAPERAARRSLPAPRTTSQGAPAETPRPVPGSRDRHSALPARQKTAPRHPGVTAPPGSGCPQRRAGGPRRGPAERLLPAAPHSPASAF